MWPSKSPSSIAHSSWLRSWLRRFRHSYTLPWSYRYFHFVCLFLAGSFVTSLELIGMQLARAAEFRLVLIIASVLFVGSVASFLILSVRPGEIWLTSHQYAVISLLLMVTNLASMLIVAAFGRHSNCLADHVKRSRSVAPRPIGAGQ
jgi:hypothetical protein